ncbi:MAG: O-antigen ligase family protein [Caulobacteraceae bacterium]
MTIGSAAGASGAPSRGRAFPRAGIAFGLSVGLLLAFSQGWIPFIVGPTGDPEASGVIRLLYFPWYAVALGLMLAQPQRSLSAALHSPLVLILIALAFVSATWSIDPGVSERRAVAVMFTTMAGMAIAARYDWPQFAEVLATAYAILAVASFWVGLLAPGLGRMSDLFPGSWRGVFFDKNGFGDEMALGIMIFLGAAVLAPRRRGLWIGFAGLAFVLILLSTSKTSLVALMIGLGAFALVNLAKRGPAMAVIMTFLGVVVFGLAASLIVFDSEGVLSLLGKDATLTGRSQIWTAVLRQIHTRPWTGFGYGAVWTDESGWGPLAWIVHDAKFRPNHSHNGWLETWLGLGYIGLAAWAGLFLQTVALAVIGVYRSRGAYLAFPFVVVYALVSLTESVTFVYNDLVWVAFAAVSVRLAMPETTGARTAERLASAAP